LGALPGGGHAIETEAAAQLSRRHRFLLWVAEHDDHWLFITLYIGLALVLSMTISLFWLVAVVAAHGVLEWFALGHKGITDRRAGRILWHLKLDVGLVLVALWLGLYIEVLFGIAGLGAAARAGAQTAARVVAWQRTIRGVLMTVDEAALVAKAAVGRNGGKGKKKPAPEPEPPDPRPPWQVRPWSGGDKFAVVFTTTCLVLILLTPVLTDHTMPSMLAVLAADLHPWP
jgi:hypothetical protein